MNNPLELLLRKQKMAQGGRIGFFGGGGADMGDPDRAGEREARGYGAEGSGSGGYNNNPGSHGGQDPQQLSINSMQEVDEGATNPYAGFDPNSNRETVATAQDLDVAPEVKQESFFDKLFSGLFTKKTAKQNFVDQVKKNPKLSKFVKDTYGITSLDDITDAQVNEINDLGNMSFGEIRDYVSKLTGQAIDDPLATGYNALTGSALGLQGIGTLGMVNALASIAMNKPAFSQNLDNMDVYGNYIGPMSTNPAVNQQIADMYGGLTESQMAQAVSQAMTNAETGGNLSMGGGNKDDRVLNQQNTEQQTIQNYMDGLTQSEFDRYNQLIGQGYNDEYAKAYLGML
tara:strand:+ start:1862 stop:2890 length:1029 start_codon:yes stop_codon:yes gene_type:complete